MGEIHKPLLGRGNYPLSKRVAWQRVGTSPLCCDSQKNQREQAVCFRLTKHSGLEF